MITTSVFNYDVRLQLSEPSPGQQVWSDDEMMTLIIGYYFDDDDDGDNDG